MDDILSAKDVLKALSFGIGDGNSKEEKRPSEDDDEANLISSEETEDEPAFAKEIKALIPEWVNLEEDGDDPEEEACLLPFELDVEAEADAATTIRRPARTAKSSEMSALEILGPDVAANLLAHLTITEIASTSLVSRSLYRASRSEELWRTKFVARWNAEWIASSKSSDINWRQAYQAAYANTHDLWMTHWNIVEPQDGDAPGRCCIRTTTTTDISEEKERRTATTNHSKCCPACRYSNLPDLIQEYGERAWNVDDAEVDTVAHALAQQEQKTSRAKLIQASTMYSIAKWVHNTRHLPFVAHPSSSKSAHRAFGAASTFHRRIQTRQYQANALHFMTDAVFLNVCDSFLKQQQQLESTSSSLEQQQQDSEIEQVEDEVYGTAAESVMEPGEHNTVAHLGPYFELTQHTWHIVRFSNPDYVRPLTFRLFVQRPDCFTVYPAEGYLDPGDSCFVYLGVRLLGGFISQATEALNVQREEVDPLFADVYAHEAHLPYAPFCIRYMFCAVTPCIPPLFASRGVTKTRPGMPASSKYKNVVSHLWEQVATEATVRTQYISAHVNVNYSYKEFCQDALVPFDIQTSNHWKDDASSKRSQPLVHVAPNVMHRFPSIFARLQNLRLEMLLSDAGNAYRTEKGCVSCGRDSWGPRMEELGRRFALQMLLSMAYQREQSLEMHNFVHVLRAVYGIVMETNKDDDDEKEDWDEVYRLLFVLHGVLMRYRALQRVSEAQRRCLTQFEVVVDLLCQLVQVKRGFQDADQIEDGPMTWRHVGVYRSLRSTDSVFEPKVFVGDLLEWKEEPEYLDGFRHLCHNPGTYCLGQQQDPNHEDREIPIFDVKSTAVTRAFHPKKREKASDIFMDDTTLSFASALAMIHDPRSLIVHGVYDRVFTPGTISRRPLLPSPYFARKDGAQRDLPLLIERAFAAHKGWTSSPVKYRKEAPIAVAVLDDRQYSLNYSDPDEDGAGLSLLAKDTSPILQKSLFDDFVRNIPAPGMGRFAFSELNESAPRNNDQIVELSLRFDGRDLDQATDNAANGTPNAGAAAPIDVGNNQERLNPLLLGARVPRLFNLFWLLSSHLGWSIQESHGGSPVMVERRVLIASQWVANSAMAMPILYTLLARAVEWISPKPIEYHLEGFPYGLDMEMRYFSPEECAFASLAVFFLWLTMGRYSERKIGRTFERSMMEHLSCNDDASFLRRVFMKPLILLLERCWDQLSPIFLQRLVFTPRWNRRTHAEVTDHIRSWRSKDLREHRSSFPAAAGRGVMTFGASVEDGGPPVSIWEESSGHKLFTGILVALGSFSACSPHFSLNMLTVFCCSIGLGMSVSLQSMETGRGISSSSSNPPKRSIFRPFGLNTVVIGFFLIGQLVGSSGGILFLAEFVVTSVSLVLGGAGTISASAMESWGCFFCLSSTAFWGYLFARVALMDGMRHKKRGASGVFLCASLVVISLLWMLTLLVWEWDVPSTAMMVRDGLVPSSSSKQQPQRPTRKQIEQHLQ